MLTAEMDRRIREDLILAGCEDTENWADQETTNPDAVLDADNLFNVIFTSGSTGKPKGVMVPHRGIINRLLWMQDAYPLDTSDRVLQKTPYSFDVSVWELFWPLMTGSHIVQSQTAFNLAMKESSGAKQSKSLRDFINANGTRHTHQSKQVESTDI